MRIAHIVVAMHSLIICTAITIVVTCIGAGEVSDLCRHLRDLLQVLLLPQVSRLILRPRKLRIE